MVSKLTRTFTLIAASWAFSFFAFAQLTVDATVPIRTPPRKNLYPGYTGGVGRRIPLLVNVKSQRGLPDRSGRAIVEFIITNIGIENLVIPISPQPADLEPADPNAEYTLTHMSLFISHANKPGILRGGADLYGNTSFPSTLFSLAPGKFVRVLALVWFPPSSESGTNNVRYRAGAIENDDVVKREDGRMVLKLQEIGSSFSKSFTLQSLFGFGTIP
jgi:hypothetical protein